MDTAQSANREELRAIQRPKILRVLAWISVLSLAVCWIALALEFSGKHFGAFDRFIPLTWFAAFVVGLSSCERLGGIVAGLATLSFVAHLFFGSGGASC